MGEVYRATDSNLKRQVAIKVLPAAVAADADRLMRFQREAEVLAALNHPNIAGIYGLEKTPECTALVMELVEGEDLSHRIAQGAMSIDDALPIAKQIADALEAAHEQGIVHRDLKPANIKVRADGTVKVLDFGLAKAMDPTAGRGPSRAGSGTGEATPYNSPTMTSPAMTEMGMILGTAAYMAPEQARGKAVDRRADIWAFGCVLYEMLTGRRAFEGDDVPDLLVAVLSKDVDFSVLPATTPPGLRHLIARCLDRNPKTRLQHIGEARIALDQAVAGGPAPAGSAAAVSSPIWRQPLAWALVAAVAAVTFAATSWLRPTDPLAAAPVVRFAVELPSGAAAQGGASSRGAVTAGSLVGDLVDFTNPTNREIAISPLGTDLAFEWQQNLWVRRLNEEQSMKLTEGSNDVRAPFFSPNGRYIGFFALEKVWRVPVAGGPAEEIGGPIPGRPFGVDWADDGHVYVGVGGHIARLPENGGSLETVVQVKENEAAADPQLLPGGEWVLFSLRGGTATWDQAQIVAESLRTHERRVLVAAGRSARVTTSGHLLYVVNGTLYGRTFDNGTLTATSDPVKLVEGVRVVNVNVTGSSYYDVSPRGDLIYVPDLAREAPVRMAWLDRKATETRLSAGTGSIAMARLSPDGRRIAAVVRGTGNRIDLWLFYTDRAGGQPLTSVGTNNFPVWSSDSQRIYFARSNSANPSATGVWQIDADIGGEGKQVAQGAAGVGEFTAPLSISADGKRLAVQSLNPKGASIAFLRLDGGSTYEHLAAPAAVGPSLSPDGRFVAYAAASNAGEAVYVQEIATGWRRMISSGLGTQPIWSRSNEIFFLSGDALKSVRVVSADLKAFAEPVTLFSRPGGLVSYDPTADGQRFLVVVPDGAAPAKIAYDIRVVLNWFQELEAKAPGGRRQP